MDDLLKRMVFVTGFARGGTTWLRNCIGFHPEIGCINRELVAFRDHGDDREEVKRKIAAAIDDLGLDTPLFVEKSPANAPFIDKAVRAFPEAKFVFIVRDPRDVFISHKRGTRKWMGGENSRVDGCMRKTRQYYEGYERAEGAQNLLLVRYEDLHQDFHATMHRVYNFIGVDAPPNLVRDCHKANDFWNVASRHIERRGEAARKGVVGDWVLYLEDHERRWYESNEFWRQFMDRYGYDWNGITYRRLLEAMTTADAFVLAEEDLVSGRLDPDRLNLILTHDIDRLTPRDFSIESVLETARIEAQLNLPGHYFFLPLDDPRYKAMRTTQIIELIQQIRQVNPRATIGLHFNAAERFFPADMPDSDDAHPKMGEAVEYLHQQIDAYGQHGVTFRVATAHGYGRRKKRPNNRDSEVFTEELKRAGILLWDTVIRPKLFDQARAVTPFADVGGAMSARFMPNKGSLIDPATYRAFVPNHLIHLLTHPGNYDVRAAMPLGRRVNVAAEQESALQTPVA